MSKHNEKNGNYFLRKGDRAMVSLGPLHSVKHCPYSCGFCYVQDDFNSYASLPEDKIIEFLEENKALYKIIYISGDTDSFAPPRTSRGLNLLLRISNNFNCDILFTTRTTFNEEQIELIKKVVKNKKKKGKKLYACISITRYSENLSYLEPNPIPSPDERIETLKHLHSTGAVTILAMRPFLPVVPIKDYLKILEKSKSFIDIALGEHFYFIREGRIYQRVFPKGISKSIEKDITRGNKMSFDVNDSDWDIWYSRKYEKIVRKKCEVLGITFSMHSDEAIDNYIYKLSKY